MKRFCLALPSFTQAITIPETRLAIEISVDSNAIDVMLSEDVVKALKWQKVNLNSSASRMRLTFDSPSSKSMRLLISWVSCCLLPLKRPAPLHLSQHSTPCPANLITIEHLELLLCLQVRYDSPISGEYWQSKAIRRSSREKGFSSAMEAYPSKRSQMAKFS